MTSPQASASKFISPNNKTRLTREKEVHEGAQEFEKLRKIPPKKSFALDPQEVARDYAHINWLCKYSRDHAEALVLGITCHSTEKWLDIFEKLNGDNRFITFHTLIGAINSRELRIVTMDLTTKIHLEAISFQSYGKKAKLRFSWDKSVEIRRKKIEEQQRRSR